MNNPLETLLSMGFTHMDKEEHFGKEPPDRFHYLFRKTQNNYQYVSLMYMYFGDVFVPKNPVWGEFLEAGFEAYWAPKNTRRPKGMMATRDMQTRGWQQVGGSIYRDTNELVSSLSKEYQLSLEEKNTEKKK